MLNFFLELVVVGVGLAVIVWAFQKWMGSSEGIKFFARIVALALWGMFFCLQVLRRFYPDLG